jgi:hypothetical protein
MLVRLRRFKGVELAAEELRGEEMSVPGGEPTGKHLTIYRQENQPRLGAAGQQDIPLGALQRRAGDHRRLTLRDALIHPGRDGP